MVTVQNGKRKQMFNTWNEFANYYVPFGKPKQEAIETFIDNMTATMQIIDRYNVGYLRIIYFDKKRIGLKFLKKWIIDNFDILKP